MEEVDSPDFLRRELRVGQFIKAPPPPIPSFWAWDFHDPAN